MKTLWQFVLGLCFLICCGTATSGEDISGRVNKYSNTAIRVLLGKENRTVQVEAETNNLYLGNFPLNSWKRLEKQARIVLTTGTKATPKITIGNEIWPVQPFYLRGGILANSTIRYRNNLYRGLLKFIPFQGTWLVVNILPLESYLAGILASEMAASWEIEALKTQAVASRTYALYMSAHPKSPHYDLVGTMLDQVYQGAGGESPRVLKAISTTTGEYLGLGGAPKKIFFHARCGGRTENENQVWGNTRAVHQSMPCPYCQKNSYSWRATVPIPKILDALGIPDTGDGLSVNTAGKTPSGRIMSLLFRSGSHERILNADMFRKIIGYHLIRSARFEWTISAKEVEFRGISLGHGVGMCQWGANYLARTGKSYREITGHYYPLLTLYGPRQAISIDRSIALSDKFPKTTVID